MCLERYKIYVNNFGPAVGKVFQPFHAVRGISCLHKTTGHVQDKACYMVTAVAV